MLTLKIETDNAAFDGLNLESECATILRVAAHRIECGNKEFPLHDTNGNRVGKCELVTEFTEE